MLKAADVSRRVGSRTIDFMQIYGRSMLTSTAFVWAQRPSLRLTPSRILPTPRRPVRQHVQQSPPELHPHR